MRRERGADPAELEAGGAAGQVGLLQVGQREGVPGGPGPRGWSSYFGFVPYTKGEIENQAIQRNFYPMDSWPHDPNAPVPQPYGLGE